MKKILFLLFLAPALHAAWTNPETPIPAIDDNGNVVSVIGCATDSAAGRLCVFVTVDDQGRAFSLTAGGDLQNKASIVNAIKAALNAKRTAALAAQAVEATRETRKGKISLSPPAIAGQ